MYTLRAIGWGCKFRHWDSRGTCAICGCYWWVHMWCQCSWPTSCDRSFLHNRKWNFMQLYAVEIFWRAMACAVFDRNLPFAGKQYGKWLVQWPHTEFAMSLRIKIHAIFILFKAGCSFWTLLRFTEQRSSSTIMSYMSTFTKFPFGPYGRIVGFIKMCKEENVWSYYLYSFTTHQR